MFTQKISLIKAFILVWALLFVFGFNEQSFAQQDPNEQEGIFEMPIEELMEVIIESPAALTRTRRRLVPAAVTTITEDMIRQCGARRLNEVFDIFVPNVQIIRHHSAIPHVGVRGIVISDTKYLLLVNGKVMNSRIDIGAMSERDLPMLADIHHIDFVRGPGSVIYGPGALIGVINIITHNAVTFEGTDIIIRQGFIEKFRSLEVRHGAKLGDERGLFLYYSVADYPGADQKDSPYVFGKSFITPDGFDNVVAGKPVSFNIVNDQEAYRSKLKHKIHIGYNDGALDIWARYTRGGIRNIPARHNVAVSEDEGGTAGNIGSRDADQDLNVYVGKQSGYQQLTIFGGYTHEFSDYLSMDVSVSYDMFDNELLPKRMSKAKDKKKIQSSREDEYQVKVLGRWTPDDKHSAALGFEYSHERFGLRSPGYPHLRAVTGGIDYDEHVSSWHTDTYSILGEHQWNISEKWTTFLGARLDRHTFTKWMFSPRAALVYLPNDKDTFKLIANRSVRREDDDKLKSESIAGTTSRDEESLKSMELRYERQHTEHLWLAADVFYDDIDLLSLAAGTFKLWGFEVEASHRTEKSRVEFSHSLTKQIEFKLDDPTHLQGYSAKPYGYGNDLASWSNHVSKLYGRYEMDPKWSVDGSLRIYWGFPGGKDWSHYNNDLINAGEDSSSYTLADPGYEKAWRASMFLNLGLEHRPTDNLTIRLDAHNILGWFNKDLNKRNYHLRVSEYRSEAAAIGFTVRYMF